jgi:hypothetical protein
MPGTILAAFADHGTLAGRPPGTVEHAGPGAHLAELERITAGGAVGRRPGGGR